MLKVAALEVPQKLSLRIIWRPDNSRFCSIDDAPRSR
jgi:hypothetical protein